MGVHKQFAYKLSKLPHNPGVYVFKDERGEVLYVGKAKDISQRVRSYFQHGKLLPADKQLMVLRVSDLDYTVVHSETEAFLLEASLIKKYRPHFNIVLKDDKNFSYIKITLFERFPRVLVVRRVVHDGSRYFGPFLSAASVYETLKLLRRLFPYRTCETLPSKPCLEYYMGRCIAPCTFEEGRQRYQNVIEDVIAFLKGDTQKVLSDLRTKMEEAASQHEFEKAAKHRDQIHAVERVTEKQHVISVKGENQDVVSVVKIDGVAGVNVFTVRGGKLQGKANFILQHTEHASEQEILKAFLSQYYTQVTDLPREVIVPYEVVVGELGLQCTVPVRGHKRKLLLLGVKNAKEYVEQSRASWEREEHRLNRGVRELYEALVAVGVKFQPRQQAQGLTSGSAALRRIEVYDISNIAGYEAVGSMIVFINGKPAKDAYKKFKIRSLATPNDFAMLQEVMFRRLKHHEWEKPNLLLIDGGKGQLSSVKKVLDTLGVTDIPVAALAKREEELFIPERRGPLRLPKNSEGLFLLQRMRDEAHRFAIGFYRKRHEKAYRVSVLDAIPSLGPKRKKALLGEFGSVQGIREASDEQIVKIVGKKVLEKVREFL